MLKDNLFHFLFHDYTVTKISENTVMCLAMILVERFAKILTVYNLILMLLRLNINQQKELGHAAMLQTQHCRLILQTVTVKV